MGRWFTGRLRSSCIFLSDRMTVLLGGVVQMTSDTRTARKLIELARQDQTEYYLYVVLTDTQSFWSRLIKAVTRDPYNHVSLAFGEDLELMYSYGLFNGDGRIGGFVQETPEMMRGYPYSMYRVRVDRSCYRNAAAAVLRHHRGLQESRYYIRGLINAWWRREVFAPAPCPTIRICSQFIAEIVGNAGRALFGDRPHTTIRPSDFVYASGMVHVRDGIIGQQEG